MMRKVYLNGFRWFFMATLLLLSFQVTISGFQMHEHSLFSTIIDLAEEESEESEKESEKKLAESESLAPASFNFLIQGKEQLGDRSTQMNMGAVHYELNSPPPEA